MSDKIEILIVEDDTPVAMMMVHLLSRAGCNTVVVRSGKRGLEIALERKFNLITLDADLSDMSGFDICRELKARHFSRQTPIIFVSGRSHFEDRQQGLGVGAADYITKPFEPADFVRRILAHAKNQNGSARTPQSETA